MVTKFFSTLKVIFLCLWVCGSFPLAAFEWQPPFESPTLQSADTSFPSTGALARDASGNTIGIWSDNTQTEYFASIYLASTNTWSSPLSIPGSSSSLPIFAAINNAGIAYAAWVDTTIPNNVIKTAIFDGSTWSVGVDAATATAPDTILDQISLAIDPNGNALLGYTLVGTLNATSYVADYNPGTTTWTSQSLSLVAKPSDFPHVALDWNGNGGAVINVESNPLVSLSIRAFIYDGGTRSFIADSTLYTTTDVSDTLNITDLQISTQGKMITTWQLNSAVDSFFVSVYDGSTWTPFHQLVGAVAQPQSSNAINNLTIGASLYRISSAFPIFALDTYKDGLWTSEVLPFTDSNYSNIALDSLGNTTFISQNTTSPLSQLLTSYSRTEFNPFTQSGTVIDLTAGSFFSSPFKLLFTPSDVPSLLWIEYAANDPATPIHYEVSIAFPNPPTPPTPAQPTNFKGKTVKVKFVSQTEIENKLKWHSNTDPNTVRYILKRDGITIAELPVNTTHYTDHNRKSGRVYVYTLYGVNANGVLGTPATVTLPHDSLSSSSSSQSR